MHTFTLTKEQQERLEQAAQLLNRTPADLVNGFVQDHIEELLEDLEDGQAATEIMRRIKSGEEKTITLQELLERYNYQEEDEQG